MTKKMIFSIIICLGISPAIIAMEDNCKETPALNSRWQLIPITSGCKYFLENSSQKSFDYRQEIERQSVEKTYESQK